MRRLRMRKSNPHKAEFGRGILAFNFVFDLGSELDGRRATKKLIRSRLAKAAVSPVDCRVSLGPNLADRKKMLDEVETLIEVSEAMDNDEAKLTWRIIWFVAIAWLRSKFKISSEPTSGVSDVLKEMRDSRTALLDASISEQELLAVSVATDRNLYSPIYLDSEPFLRLHLQSYFVGGFDESTKTFSDPDNLVECSVTLLLHRTGIAILTILVPTPSGLSSDALVPLTQSFSFKHGYCEIAEPLISAGLRDMGRTERSLSGTWNDGLIAGVRWRSLELPSVAGLDETFQFYRDAIEFYTGAKPEFQGWHCYPVAFFNGIACSCDDRESWLRNHRQELDELASRTEAKHNFKNDSLRRFAGENYSDLSTEDLYVPSCGVTRVFWRGDDVAPHIGECQPTIAVTENVLIQYWQLVRYDEILATERRDLRQLNVLQRELVDGLDEYRRPQFAWGSMASLAAIIGKDKQIDELYQRSMERTSSLQSLIGARQTVLNARRSTGFAAVALLVTAMLGLSSLAASIKTLAESQVVLSSIGIAISAETQGKLVVAIWLLSLAAILGFIVWQIFRQTSARRVRRTRKKFGSIPVGNEFAVEIANRPE